jgi:hypothetical protein
MDVDGLIQKCGSLGMVVHACNPTYVGGLGRRIMFQADPWGKNVNPYL